MAAKPIINFKALQVANEHRNAYGLRYNDFERYRKHCANRTHRIRSSLKTTHGRGKDFKKLPAFTTETIKDGHLHLLLFEAERAWSYSQELYGLSLLPANEDKASSLRHSATGRFRRAVNWSTQLLSHCQSLYAVDRLSAENLFQATVYTIILNGRFLRYRDDFEDALIQLSVARSLLDELANAAVTSRDQALAVLFSDEISPEIRYCAHELGRAKAYDIDGIVAELGPKNRTTTVENSDALISKLKSQGQAAAKGESRMKLKVLTWEGEPVPVRNPELVDVLLKVQDAETRLAETQNQGSDSGKVPQKSKKGVAAYDAILSALSDAEELSRKLSEAQQVSASSTATTSNGRDIHFVYAFIVYQLLRYRIQRDLLLVSALLASQPESTSTKNAKTSILKTEAVDSRLYPAVVKLLDTVLQSFNQMRTLSVVDDNPDLATAVDARISLTKARRCIYLAHCYAPLMKHAESIALLQHGSLHLRETTSLLSLSPGDADALTAANPDFFPIAASTLKEIEEALSATSTRYKREWFAYNGGSVTKDPKDYKKPLFFDIALNYVELPMDRLLVRAGKSPQVAAAPAVAAPVSHPPKQQQQQQQPKVEAPVEKKAPPKAKAEDARPSTHQPQPQARGGLSSLLGGWWGKS